MSEPGETTSITFVQRRYMCSKHGDIGGAVFFVHLHPGDQAAQQFAYCFVCFNEMVADHCFQVRELGE